MAVDKHIIIENTHAKHFVGQLYHITLCHKTGQLLKSLFRGPRGQYESYTNIKYNCMGRVKSMLIYFDSKTNIPEGESTTKTLWWKTESLGSGEMVYYEDSNGEMWHKRWGVDFPFYPRLKRMQDKANTETFLAEMKLQVKFSKLLTIKRPVEYPIPLQWL